MNKNMIQDNEQGFTMIELIIGMMLMLIIVTATLSLFNVSIRSHQFSMGRVNDLQQSRLAINKVAEEIRYAKSIAMPVSPSRTVQYTDVDDIVNTLTFNPSDKKVYLKHGDSAAQAITSGVFTNFQFKLASRNANELKEGRDPKLLIIEMTLEDDRTHESLETEIMVHWLN